MKKIYGLFRYTYDWHEFERIICVSESVEALEQRYAAIKALRPYCDPLIAADENREEFAEAESNHYAIRELEVV